MSSREKPTEPIEVIRADDPEVMATLTTLRRPSYSYDEFRAEVARLGRAALHSHARAGRVRLTPIGRRNVILALDAALFLVRLRREGRKFRVPGVKASP